MLGRSVFEWLVHHLLNTLRFLLDGKADLVGSELLIDWVLIRCGLPFPCVRQGAIESLLVVLVGVLFFFGSCQAGWGRWDFVCRSRHRQNLLPPL